VDITAQLQQMQAQLGTLAGNAKAALQGNAGGKVEAMVVWQQANDLLELLRAIPGVVPKHRKRG
jgi:phosphoglycerate-specific signal transduction histidine kinase